MSIVLNNAYKLVNVISVINLIYIIMMDNQKKIIRVLMSHLIKNHVKISQNGSLNLTQKMDSGLHHQIILRFVLTSNGLDVQKQ